MKACFSAHRSGDMLHFIDGIAVHDKTEAEIDDLLNGLPFTPVHLALSSAQRRVVTVKIISRM